MKTRLVSSPRLPLAAGALALVVTVCGPTSGFADNSFAPAGYAEQPRSTSTPPSVDPFSRDYKPFPASSSESAGIVGHSYYCEQHYSQPGCQTLDFPRTRHSRGNRVSRTRGDSAYDSAAMNTE